MDSHEGHFGALDLKILARRRSWRQRRGQGPLRREDVGGGADPHRGREAVGALSRRSLAQWQRDALEAGRGQGPAGCRTPAGTAARARWPGGDARGGASGSRASASRRARQPGCSPEGRRGRLRVGPEERSRAGGAIDGGGGGQCGEGDGRRGGRAREAEGRGRGAQGDASATQKQETRETRTGGRPIRRGCAGTTGSLARVLIRLGISKSSYEYREARQ